MATQLADSLKLVCAGCMTTNRVPASRLGEAPKCGKCSMPLLRATPVVLDEGRFDRYVGNTGLPVLVDFFATWCGPCHAMAPAFEQLASEFSERAVLAKVDIDAAPALSGRYAIRSVPTLMLFKNGQESARVSGALDAARLRGWLAQQL